MALTRAEIAKRYRDRHPGRSKTSRQKYMRKLKSEVIEAYGGKCSCCGESILEFLTIDHIYNDGYKEKASGVSGFYFKLKKLGFPKDRYRCLCYNCNCGRRINDGICPHEGGGCGKK